MAIWLEEASTVASRLADAASESGVMPRDYADAKQGLSPSLHRSAAYKLYKRWCAFATRKPLGNVAWGSEMEKLGHSLGRAPPQVVKQDGSQTPAKRSPHSAVASGQLAVVIRGSLDQAGLLTRTQPRTLR